MNRSDTDVLIVGGGVIGLCAAYYLQQRGRSVCIVERGEPGCGASHGNCGTITPSHAPPLAGPGVISKALRWMLQADAPLHIPPRLDPKLWAWLWRFAWRCRDQPWWQSARAKAALLNRSRQALETLIAAESLDCEFRASGLLYVYRDPRAYAAQVAVQASLTELGIASRLWDAQRLSAEEPALLPGAAGAMFFPGDACLRPDRYVAELRRVVAAAGVDIQSAAEVVAIDAEHAEIGLQDGRRLSARALLLASGAWSPRFAPALGLNLPIQPGKGYSITYDRPSLAPRWPMVLRERSVCVTAWDSGFRLGSTMEFSGYDTSLNRTRLDALVRASQEYLIEPEGPARREEWYGWRPMTWDDVPIIGASPRYPRCFVAAGHGMLGVSMSAATGELVAAQICGDTPTLDPQPYAPGRFLR